VKKGGSRMPHLKFPASDPRSRSPRTAPTRGHTKDEFSTGEFIPRETQVDPISPGAEASSVGVGGGGGRGGVAISSAAARGLGDFEGFGSFGTTTSGGRFGGGGFGGTVGAGGVVSPAPVKQADNSRINSFIDQLEAERKSSQASNQQRFDQAQGLYDQIIENASQTGEARLAGLEQRKERNVASGFQDLVNRGLSNTTRAAGLGQKFEAEVGGPERLRIGEDKNRQLGQALGQKAQFLTNVQDKVPDFRTISNLVQRASS